MAIQEAVLDAVHSHSRGTPTFTVPVPPDAGNDEFDPLMAGWQRTVVGEVTLVVVELPHAPRTASADADSSVANSRVVTARQDAQCPPKCRSGAPMTIPAIAYW
jgi:hypothetical protein